MPQAVSTAVVNNFSKGLVTEATGLNFPENACTAVDNCIFTLIGDVTRREGIDFEANSKLNAFSTTGLALNIYKWNNAGGDGETQLIVQQIGGTLYFYRSSSATITSPLSNNLISTTVAFSGFVASGTAFDPTMECTFADGNGYLFVYHPNCDPFYVTYSSGAVAGFVISLQIRDFVGVQDLLATNTRPSTLSNDHLYNLENQGWSAGSPWYATSSTTQTVTTGAVDFAIQTGLTIVNGTNVNISLGSTTFDPGLVVMSASVTAYNSSTGVIALNSFVVLDPALSGETFSDWRIFPTNIGYINTWFSEVGNFPSNADVWWYFKDDTNVYNPATTSGNVTLSTGNAPQGHFLLNPFIQNRSAVGALPGLTTISTVQRPKNGAWFQGRVWYTGLNDQQAASGDALYYTWTENIYFSQIVQTTADFGSCYQTNDPTSENLFGLLPTDGGVITIQGSGAIYKLFPIANGMIVFAANGVWFITGSQGIGFAADDYTITKLSSVQSVSSSSYVDVLGLPYFWNEEGIYAVQPQQGGSLTVNNISLGVIDAFYQAIPYQCIQFARGSYHPLDYVIQWVYNTTPDDGNITNRYSFQQVLAYNTYNKSYYTYTIAQNTPAVNGIVYVSSPGGSSAPDPVFKYPTSTGSVVTFSEENNPSYIDWFSYDGVGINYDSFFTTGYILRGQGIKKWESQYIQVFCNSNGAASAYKIQGIWDYANSPNSGKYSSIQLVTNGLTYNDIIIRRHKVRGRGFALQYNIQSVDGMPFDIIGWATVDTTNQGT